MGFAKPGWEIFDEAYAGYYDLTTGHRPDSVEVENLARLIAEQPLGQFPHIMDMGCGTGRHARALAEKGFRISGYDPSRAMIQRARSIPGKAQFYCASAAELPGDSFDFAYSLGHVVNYLTADSELMNFFQGIHLALRPRGLYYFEVWDPAGLKENPPVEVIREFPIPKGKIRRMARPEVSELPDKLGLHYLIEKLSDSGEILDSLQVSHALRLYSIPKLKQMLLETGFIDMGVRRALGPDPGMPDKFLGLLARRGMERHD